MVWAGVGSWLLRKSSGAGELLPCSVSLFFLIVPSLSACSKHGTDAARAMGSHWAGTAREASQDADRLLVLGFQEGVLESVRGHVRCL